MKLLRTEYLQDKKIIQRLMNRTQTQRNVKDSVSKIIADVQQKGDRAVIKYTRLFDKVKMEPESLLCSASEFSDAKKNISKAFIETARRIQKNIIRFHEKQLPVEWEINAGDNAKLGEIIRPVEKAGIYIPGGTAPLVSTLFMTVIPANVAGVKDIIVATPPGRDGKINPYMLFVSELLGVTRIFKMGGAQAIAAMAFGTKTVPKVDKIVGPGNMFVAEAKRQLFGIVDIDCIAGPSEILVLADKNANPQYIAADILSQAEHGSGGETSLLVTNSKALAKKVMSEISRQLVSLKRNQIIKKALSRGTFAIVTRNMTEAINISNEFAPEHLEIISRNPEVLMKKINNAGAIFIGSYSPVPVGDFIAGPSHVLPTNGGAKAFSGLSVMDFLKRIGTINYSRKKLLKSLEDLRKIASVEGLDAHAHAVEIRCRDFGLK